MKKEPIKPIVLREIHCRIFHEDVELLQKLAEEHGVPWQVELRLLVRRALRGEKKEILVLK